MLAFENHLGTLLTRAKEEIVNTYLLDDMLKAFFLPPLTIDAFLSPNHKIIFDFTLDNPRNV